MKVLIFISTMYRGGAARVTSTLCNEMTKAGYEVHIAANTETDSVFYELPSTVVVHNFYVPKRGAGLFDSVKMNVGYCQLARQIIKKTKPNVVVSVEPRMFLYAKIGSIGLGLPVIACDHTSFSRKQDVLTNFIRFKFYGTADALTILTKKDYDLLGDKFPNKIVIYNPLSFSILDHPTTRQQNILCAGRLDVWHIKGFDIILECWQSIANKYPNWILEIAGDGTYESIAFLQNAINEKGLTNRVVLLGQVENMREKLSQTSIFALPSRVEGFPMVLMEAMSQGCACVAYEVDGATLEMITNNQDGIIIKDLDVEGFANGLALLIEDSILRENLSTNALQSIQRFSSQSFMNTWNNLISKVVNNRH